MRLAAAAILLPLAFPALAAAPATAQTSTQPAIGLSVDLTQAPRQLFHVRETVRVAPGPLTLYYPKWIPGEHSPSGPLEHLAGLHLAAEGKAIAWRRDLENMYAFHLDVPAGVRTLEASFDFLSPPAGGKFGQSASTTPDLVDLEWNQVVLYPAGKPVRDVLVEPSVRLPAGWTAATALEDVSGGASGGGERHFKTVTLEELVDSPLIAGRYFREVDLAPGDRVPVTLDVVADAAADLEISAPQIEHLRNLVKQAYALFGARHYARYRFLFTLSDNTGHFGLEHHQSSDDRQSGNYFIESATNLAGAHLLPHEYVHSWNGKFRRPAGLLTAEWNATPMKGDLLWVYEGLTEYLGNVLAARSGVLTAAQYREQLAANAATMDHRPGRAWRPLQDTADEAQILYYVHDDWKTWRRETDFYDEGELLWLDVDTKIRELSRGRKSMDDFARAFYGQADGSTVPVGYGFDDVVATLKRVQPLDWAAFLRTRLDAKEPNAPLDGITRGGYRLVYGEAPSEYFKAYEKRRKVMNMMFSIGMIVSTEKEAEGLIQDVLWDGPAFKAGVGASMKLIAVNGHDFAANEEVLKQAIVAAKGTSAPIQLLLRNQDTYATYDVAYHDGLKYPRLEPVPGATAYLDAIVAPVE